MRVKDGILVCSMKKLYFVQLFTLVALLGLNSVIWRSLGLGLIFLVLYFYVVSKPAGRWLGRFFAFSPNFPKRLLGAWCGFLAVAVFAGILVVFGIFSPLRSVAVLAVSGVLWFLLDVAFPGPQLDSEIMSSEVNTFLSPKIAKALLILYGVVAAVCFSLLISSRSSSVLATPWQTIHPAFIYFFAAATALLGLLIFSPFKARLVLLLFVVHSLLIHSYLPLTHTLLYGADGWRHLATEERLIRGEGTVVPVISDGASSPKQKIDLGLISYSQMWGVSALIGNVTAVSLLDVNRWLLPGLFGIVVPILIYELAQTLGWKREWSFGAVLLSFLPFALTSTGSFTLPVSFGFLVCLFFITMLVKRLVMPERKQLFPIGLLFVVLCAGYALYALVGALAFIVSELFLQLRRKNIQTLPGFSAVIVVGSIGILGIFPALEYFARYSSLVPRALWLTQLQQVIGNFTALYLANGPRPHDIATGNIIFNQVPLASFVPNVLTLNRWWLVMFMLGWWALCCLGWYALIKKRTAVSGWFATLAIGLFGAYGVSRYFFQGEQVLTRRLEPVLALISIFLIVVALRYVLGRFPFVVKKWVVVGCCLVMSAVISASFTLGPDTLTVSQSEYIAMQQVLRVGDVGSKPCVIADTYPLLALEALSRKTIIGGGFPISHDFEQPEQQKIYIDLAADPQNSLALAEAFKVTGAEKCFLVAPFDSRKVTPQFEAAFGGVGVWSYSK